MRDHDLVIQLHAITDQGIGQRTAIHGGVGADLDVITDGHPTDLCNLLPDALLVGETEAFATDHRTGLNHHPLANLHIVVQRHARSQPTTLTDHATRADHAMGTDAHISTDASTAFDNRKSANTRTLINLSVFGDLCRGMNTRRSLGLAIEQMRQLSIGQVWVGHDQRIARVAFGIGCSQQHGTGLGLCQKLAVLGIGQEAQLFGPGLL